MSKIVFCSSLDEKLKGVGGMETFATKINKSGRVLLMLVKKKTAVIAVCALLACVAIYLNWSYQRGIGDDDAAAASVEDKTLGEAEYVDNVDGETVGEEDTDAAATDDYFASAKLSRQKARDEAVSVLETITKNTSSTKEAIAKAETDIAIIAANAVKEARIEGLVKAKGYKDCVAYISDDSVDIVVSSPTGGLKATDVAKIKDITVSETGIAADKIKIVEAK